MERDFITVVSGLPRSGTLMRQIMRLCGRLPAGMSKFARGLARVPLHLPAWNPANPFLKTLFFPLPPGKPPAISRRSTGNPHLFMKKQNSLNLDPSVANSRLALMGALAIAGGTTAYGQIISVAPPANFVVPPGTAATNANWDLNGDGTMDFTFNYRYPNTATGSGVIWQANMNPFAGSQATNGLISYAGPYLRYAFARTLGSNVGPGEAFSTVTQVTLGSRYRSGGVPSYYGGFAASNRTPGTIANGAVAPGTLAYVGFRFNAVDGTHYGWIQLSVGAGSINFVSAAYQATPNTPIAAGAIPEPGTLGLLALGAVGVVGAAIKRRRAA